MAMQTWILLCASMCSGKQLVSGKAVLASLLWSLLDFCWYLFCLVSGWSGSCLCWVGVDRVENKANMSGTGVWEARWWVHVLLRSCGLMSLCATIQFEMIAPDIDQFVIAYCDFSQVVSPADDLGQLSTCSGERPQEWRYQDRLYAFSTTSICRSTSPQGHLADPDSHKFARKYICVGICARRYSRTSEENQQY